MEKTKVRVRFAPSPTGPLHIGGVRTALYNYLFAKKNGGDFVLRIEDTDQNRYVKGAEEYIQNSLSWLGLEPDESPGVGGPHGPYRQSERKDLYKSFVDTMLESGAAYYAFDSPEELTKLREDFSEKGLSFKYDSSTRLDMKNSLTLSSNEVVEKLKEGSNTVVRLKVPSDGSVRFEDVVRGSLEFNCSNLDDKVLLKADGMPTYHLANVVDDRSMKITHVIRGEEWLSSTPIHVLLYEALGWKEEMPKFVHLPLLLKPNGKGKLSKRDGAKFGFPVFPLLWIDPTSGDRFEGFKENGFLPEAVLNFLAFMGWNPGTEQEKFGLNELIDHFSLENIVKSGAHFNYDKAKWFNQQYLKEKSNEDLIKEYSDLFSSDLIPVNKKDQLIELLKDRIETLNQFEEQALEFISPPEEFDLKVLKKKLKRVSVQSMIELYTRLEKPSDWSKSHLSSLIKDTINEMGVGMGDIMQLLRVFLTGRLGGPDLFSMMEILEKEEVLRRMNKGIEVCNELINE